MDVVFTVGGALSPALHLFFCFIFVQPCVQCRTSQKVDECGRRVLTLADGIVLVVAAAAQMMITSASGSLSSQDAGATGGVGILSVLYSCREASATGEDGGGSHDVHQSHLPRVPAELGQSDQAFSRRLMEDGQITPGS